MGIKALLNFLVAVCMLMPRYSTVIHRIGVAYRDSWLILKDTQKASIMKCFLRL